MLVVRLTNPFCSPILSDPPVLYPSHLPLPSPSRAFLLTASGTLRVGALQDGYHILVSTPPPDQLSDLQCAVTDAGIFLSGSILAFFSVILMEAAYLIGVRANSEAWLTARYLHSSASMLIDVEAFSREMADASVTVVPVPARDVEEGEMDDSVLTPLRKMA